MHVIFVHTYVSVHIYIYMLYICTHLSIYIYQSICLSVRLSICRSIYLSVYIYRHTSTSKSIKLGMNIHARCMYVCKHVCMCAYTQSRTQRCVKQVAPSYLVVVMHACMRKVAFPSLPGGHRGSDAARGASDACDRELVLDGLSAPFCCRVQVT